MPRPIPDLPTEDDERAFWAEHDSADYIDWRAAQPVIYPNLKTTTRTISLRLPESMLDELKTLANKRDVPYQSLIKMFLRQRIDDEFRRTGTDS